MGDPQFRTGSGRWIHWPTGALLAAQAIIWGAVLLPRGRLTARRFDVSVSVLHLNADIFAVVAAGIGWVGFFFA